jgi:DNA-binding NarL/FixJ family response regulator
VQIDTELKRRVRERAQRDGRKMLAPARKVKLLTRYADGVALEELAREFGISVSGVRYHVRKAAER